MTTIICSQCDLDLSCAELTDAVANPSEDSGRLVGIVCYRCGHLNNYRKENLYNYLNDNVNSEGHIVK